MAKSAIIQKKRVAHFLPDSSGISDGNDNVAGLDVVSDIIKVMENNFHAASAHSNNSHVLWSSSDFKTSKDKRQNTSQIISPPHLKKRAIVPQNKKYNLNNRKFPLMEKSQKVLKLIKHNQKIPKQRAHLAALSSSPPETVFSKKSKDIANKTKKYDDRPLLKSVKTNNTLSKKSKDVANKTKKCDDRPLLKNVKTNKISKKLVKSGVQRLTEKAKSSPSSTPSEPIIKMQEGSSNSGSSDDEYEKFIKLNKLDLPKKQSKPKSSSTNNKKRKLSGMMAKKRAKKTLYNALKSSSSEYESEISDDDNLSSNYHRRTRSKVCHKIDQTMSSNAIKDCSDSESEMDSDNDHWSSSPQPKCKKAKRKQNDVYVKKVTSKTEHDPEKSLSESDDSPLQLCHRTKRAIVCQIKDTDGSSSVRNCNIIESETEKYDDDGSSHLYYRRSKDCRGIKNYDSYSVPKDTGMNRISNDRPQVPEDIGKCDNSESEMEMYDDTVIQNSSESDIEENEISSNKVPNDQVTKDSLTSELPEGMAHALKDDNLSKASEKQYIDSSAVKNDSSRSKNNLVMTSIANDSSIVDLTLSDNECENVDAMSASALEDVKRPCVNVNESVDCSEESDIELLDVVLLEPRKEEIPNLISHINEQGIKTEKIDAQSLIATESLAIPQPEVEPCVTKIEPENKYEATYVTNICEEFNDASNSNSFIAKDLCFSELPSCISFNLKAEDTVHKEIKQEYDDDDDIIILDGEASDNLMPQSENSQSSSSHNKLNLELKANVKSEKVAELQKDVIFNSNGHTEEELRLFEVACSNLRDPIPMPNNNSQELLIGTTSSEKSPDLITYLELFKKEVATYKRIVDTEASVEATFKLIENQQAEKVVQLKSVIQRILRGSGSSTNLKELLDSPQFSKTRTVTEKVCKLPSSFNETAVHVPNPLPCSSTVDCKPIILPISSIPEIDIKPDLSQLQLANSSFSRNDTSFGEKCTVCGKDAVAACQQCAKVFYCSNTCGKKYWDAGHGNECKKS